METKALKAKRPGFSDDRYNETQYYVENGKDPLVFLNLMCPSPGESMFSKFGKGIQAFFGLPRFEPSFVFALPLLLLFGAKELRAVLD